MMPDGGERQALGAMLRTRHTPSYSAHAFTTLTMRLLSAPSSALRPVRRRVGPGGRCSAIAFLLLTLQVPAAAQAQTTARPAASTTASTAPAPFAVKVVGKGPPMLFIPGLTSGGAVWDDIVAAFADRYQCHVFTLAGFAGQPPIAADSTWLRRMRDAIVAYAKAERLERPIVVGHSLGGFLALDIAAHEPALPRAVVNVDGLPFLPGTISPEATLESVKPMVAQMRRAMTGGNPAQAAQAEQMQEMQLRSMVRDTSRLPMVRSMGRASDRATVAEAMSALYSVDLRPDLARITAPVLNLHAWVAYRSYGQTRPRMEQLLANQYAALRTGTTRISDSAYHFIMLDEPAWLISEMQGFLNAAR